MAVTIPCDTKYYFVKLPFVLADLSDQTISVEAGGIQKEIQGSFTLYESPVASGSYVPDQPYIVNYADKQNLRSTESYSRIHLLPYTNMPVTLLRILNISHLVRGSFTEESLRARGIHIQSPPRLVAIVKGLLDDSLYAGPAAYLSDSWTFVVGESYYIREYRRPAVAGGTWHLLAETVSTFLGGSQWADLGALKAGYYDDDKYRLITAVDNTNCQYGPKT